MSDDLATLRNRINGLRDDIDRLIREGHGQAGAFVARTVLETTYPTAAARYFACVPSDLTGTEAEGASAVVGPGVEKFHAFNLSTTIPAVGSNVLAVLVPDGRFVIGG